MFNSEARTKGRTKQRELAKQSCLKVSDFINQLKAGDPSISLQQMANRLNANGFKTRQGKQFTPMQVKRILDRESNGSSLLQQLNELRSFLGREQHKVGQAYLEIQALKLENHGLKIQLEQVGIEIRGLFDERDKQRDIISQERDRLLVEVDRLRSQVSNSKVVTPDVTPVVTTDRPDRYIDFNTLGQFLVYSYFDDNSEFQSFLTAIRQVPGRYFDYGTKTNIIPRRVESVEAMMEIAQCWHFEFSGAALNAVAEIMEHPEQVEHA